MPISKKQKFYYTAEEYAAAKQNSNALEYAQRQGYELVQTGKYVHLKEHDSLVFTQSGHFFWNSRGVQGRALEFIVYYEGKSFAEAVLILAGQRDSSSPIPTYPRITSPKPSNDSAFQLPQRSENNRQLYGYLCGNRKIDRRIVTLMLQQQILYPAVSSSGRSHNACFISYGPEGKPCSAFLRGMTSDFKGEVPGGDKRWGWTLHGHEVDTLLVFEAAIDAASYASYLLQQGQEPMQGRDYLALGGLQFRPIDNYLRLHPNTKAVQLLLDNDSPGQAAAVRFHTALQEMNYSATILHPPCGKDWNEALQALSSGKSRQSDTV